MGKLGIIKPEKTIFTLEEVVEKFPEKKRTITQELVDYLNEANSDPAFDGDEFMNNLLTYKDVMLNGSASIKDFVNAMRFCAYLEACDDNATEAYKKARMDSPWVQERMNAKSGSKAYNELTHVASRYRKENKLVRQILTQTDMPLYLMFQGSRYRAVSVLEKEMLTAPFSKDRIAAADKLLSHVKPPDNQQIELSVGMNQEAKDLNQQLSEQLAKSVELQHQLLKKGIDFKEATKLGINLEDDIEEGEIIGN